MTWRIIQGDCVERMAELDEASVDAVVCDPPYGIGFMGHEWDQPGVEGTANGKVTQYGRGHYKQRASASMVAGEYDQTAMGHRRFQGWCEVWAREALRALKPGGHLLAFGGTRTAHRLACATEDAGFEIRDTICWLYASGFPKSLDVSKAIDRAAGAERDKVQRIRPDGKLPGRMVTGYGGYDLDPTMQSGSPITPEAERWQGWGTALKPAHEPIVVARKPLAGTVAQNVLETGCGALNIDATRVSSGQRPSMDAWDDEPNLCDSCAANAGNDARRIAPARRAFTAPSGAEPTTNARDETPLSDTSKTATGCSAGPCREEPSVDLIDGGNSSTDGSGKTPTDLFHPDTLSITSTRSAPTTDSKICSSCGLAITSPTTTRESPSGRWPSNVILDEEAARLLDEQTGEQASRFFYCAKAGAEERSKGLNGHRSIHPTVKPISLMRWLVRLVTPLSGTILDPFAGSGTTGCAATLEGFDFIGIEREAEYVDIAKARIAWWDKHRGDGEAVEILRAGEERDAVEATGQLGLEL